MELVVSTILKSGQRVSPTSVLPLSRTVSGGKTAVFSSLSIWKAPLTPLTGSAPPGQEGRA